MRMPTIDSATHRGVKTTFQAFIAGIFVFGTGLFGVINSVPGCSEAVAGFLKDNAVSLASGIGVSTGISTFIWNKLFNKDISTY